MRRLISLISAKLPTEVRLLAVELRRSATHCAGRSAAAAAAASGRGEAGIGAACSPVTMPRNSGGWRARTRELRADEELAWPPAGDGDGDRRACGGGLAWRATATGGRAETAVGC